MQLFEIDIDGQNWGLLVLHRHRLQVIVVHLVNLPESMGLLSFSEVKQETVILVGTVMGNLLNTDSMHDIRHVGIHQLILLDL